MKPEYLSIDRLRSEYDIGRTLGYELLNRGEIRARKLNRKTLIERASVDEFMARQPAYAKVG